MSCECNNKIFVNCPLLRLYEDEYEVKELKSNLFVHLYVKQIATFPALVSDVVVQIKGRGSCQDLLDYPFVDLISTSNQKIRIE